MGIFKKKNNDIDLFNDGMLNEIAKRKKKKKL
jgi:hypothetical protein